MIYIGSHVSQKDPDGLLGSVNETIKNSANALMFFTGAPQSTRRKDLELLKIDEAKVLLNKYNIKKEHIVVHAPYIINLANPNPEKRKFAIDFLTNEVKRSEKMCAGSIVLHPGASLGHNIDNAISYIISGINKVIDNTKDLKIKIAIETMAGKGTEVGSNFFEMRKILDGIIKKDRIGVCLDTCHIFDAGYDIVNKYDEVFNEFDKIVGFNNLLVIHLNDSKNKVGSKKDRHANIGLGEIGFNTLSKVVYDKRFSSIAKILETPYYNDKSPYKEEIRMLKENKFDPEVFSKL